MLVLSCLVSLLVGGAIGIAIGREYEAAANEEVDEDLNVEMLDHLRRHHEDDI